MPANAGDADLIPGSRRSPGGRNGNPLQYSCLGNPRDRGSWWITVHGVAKSQIRLSTHAHKQVTPGQRDRGKSLPPTVHLEQQTL